MRFSLHRALASAVEVVTWGMTGALVALVSANVFARYVLEIGILWTEEVSRLLFVWVVFLGSYVALRRKAHMAIDILVERLAPAARDRLVLASRLVVLLFLIVIAWAGGRLVLATVEFGRVTPILGISAAWAYLSVPTAAVLMAIETVAGIAAAWPFRAQGAIRPAAGMHEVEP